MVWSNIVDCSALFCNHQNEPAELGTAMPISFVLLLFSRLVLSDAIIGTFRRPTTAAVFSPGEEETFRLSFHAGGCFVFCGVVFDTKADTHCAAFALCFAYLETG